VSKPSLPQAPATAEERDDRAQQLALARTAYNYVRSYPNLANVPLSARLPSDEAFSADYNLKLASVLAPLTENFLAAVAWVLGREFDDDASSADIKAIAKAFEGLNKLNLDYDNDKTIITAFVETMKTQLPDLLTRMSNLPSDVQRLLSGFETTLREAGKEGPTAFLKTLLYAMVATGSNGDRDLRPTSVADFESLFQTLPKPASLTQEREEWMPTEGKPCEQDWFFGYLQVAGFNTTNLCGVSPETPAARGIGLAELLRKMPITDGTLQSVVGNRKITLESAAQAGKLYVCDYAALADAKGSKIHDEWRYVTAPIALFYWNDDKGNLPAGYPTRGYGGQPGFLQPIAIQLAQAPDPEKSPIFTPNDCAGGNDKALLKWQIAKLFVNAACATQHESVAHLGECHLVMDAIVVATHRQLAERHPLFKLLWPHMRFTLSINDGAMHNLVIPGGVVATNVGTAISSTLDLVNSARIAYSWDDQSPERNFEKRGVAGSRFVFPFRDDTLLVWNAIKTFVGDYLAHYYDDALTLEADLELQGWINELASPQYANIQGISGLVWNEEKQSWGITSLKRLTEIVAQIIYTAGPKHAAVNYPQYPLGAYAPSVAAAVYDEPPTKSQELAKPEQCLKWFLPLDVALYALSFEYLLSGMQYDKLGQYDSDLLVPYFEDGVVRDLVAAFQAKLASVEMTIRKSNHERPLPYPYQLPSLIPNSISI